MLVVSAAVEQAMSKVVFTKFLSDTLSHSMSFFETRNRFIRMVFSRLQDQYSCGFVDQFPFPLPLK